MEWSEAEEGSSGKRGSRNQCTEAINSVRCMEATTSAVSLEVKTETDSEGDEAEVWAG